MKVKLEKSKQGGLERGKISRKIRKLEKINMMKNEKNWW